MWRSALSPATMRCWPRRRPMRQAWRCLIRASLAAKAVLRRASWLRASAPITAFSISVRQRSISPIAASRAARHPAPSMPFLYTERGVYRTGETVALTALLRDVRGVAVPGVPLTLVVRRPDGVEYRRVVVEDQGLGGRALSIPDPAGLLARNMACRCLYGSQGFADRRRDVSRRGLCPGASGSEPLAAIAGAAGRPAGGDRSFGAVSLWRPGFRSRRVRRGDGRGVRIQRHQGARRLCGGPRGRAGRNPRPSRSNRRRRRTRRVAPACRSRCRMRPRRAPPKRASRCACSETGGRAVERSVTLPILPERPRGGGEEKLRAASSAKARMRPSMSLLARPGRDAHRQPQRGLESLQDRTSLPMVQLGWALGLRARQDHPPHERRAPGCRDLEPGAHFRRRSSGAPIVSM